MALFGLFGKIATGDLCRNGDEAAQGKLLKLVFKIYDRINLTILHDLYDEALEAARQNNRSRLKRGCTVDFFTFVFGAAFQNIFWKAKVSKLNCIHCTYIAQVDWATLTDLLSGMPGMKGKSYSAVLRWVIATLDDVNFRKSITTSESRQLLRFAEEACTWRQKQLNSYRKRGEADDRHQHALDMWEDVRNKVKEVDDEACQ